MTDNNQKIKDEFLKIRNRYKEQSRKRGFNALIYGDFGTGKTYMLHTAPKPVFVHSFDPGGSVTLRKWIDKGEVIVDSSFESDETDNPKEPQNAYVRWEKEFNRLREMNFFDNVGTYCIDSLTTMGESLMRGIMERATSKKSGKRSPYHKEIPTFIPEIQDYNVQQLTMRDYLNVCCGLPCNFICTGHIDKKQDQVTGGFISTVMVSGKAAQKIPLLFDEVYIADYKSLSSGPEYFLRMSPEGMYKARSRLAATYDLDRKEKPDISYILNKCNYESPDKNLYLDEEKTETT